MKAFLLRFVFMSLFLSATSWGGAVITYHGRILDSQNRPLEASNVTFRIRIYSPNPGKCLLYEETRTNVNMSGSQGVFVLPIGDGAGTRTGLAPATLAMEKIFANNGTTIPGLICNSGDSYTSQPLDQRQMIVSYDDHSGYVSASNDGFDDLPLMNLNYVPFAVSAHDAQNVGGAPAASILRVQGGSAAPLSVANFAELLSLINGTSSQYEKVGKLNGSNIPVLTNGQVLGWSGGGWSAITPLTAATETDPTVKSFAKSNLPSCAANAFLQSDGSGNFVCVTVPGASGGTVTSIAAGTGLKTNQAGNAAITNTGSLYVDVGTNAGQLVQLEAGGKLPAVDGSQLTHVNAETATIASGLTNTASINISGTITAAGNITSTSGDIVVNNGNIQTNKALTAKDGLFLYDQKTPTPGSVGLKAPADVPTNYVLTLPTAQGTNGQVLGMSATTGQLTWINASSGSVTSVTADAPLTVDSSNVASPKVSMPAASAAQDGYLKKEDFATFNGKADGTDPRFTDSRAPTGSAGGDLGNNYPNPTVEKIKGQSVAGTATTPGQVLRFESGAWVPSAVKLSELAGVTGILGSAFNVGSCGANQTMNWSSLTDSFTCANISITSSQISDLSLGALASKNSVDLSTAEATGVLPVTKGGTGLNAAGTSNQILGMNAAGTALAYKAMPTCGANQYITFDGTGFICANDAGAAGTVASISSGTPALTFSSATGTITANISDATTAAKGIVQLAADGGTTAGTVVQADDARLSNSRIPTGSAGGDLTGNYPNPTLNAIVTAGIGTKITYDAKGRVTSSTTLSATDIPALDWTKITTGKPTTLSGYGITDAVRNAGSGAGNVITSMQSGNTAGRPAAGTDGRLYLDTQASVIYRDNGTTWTAIASNSGTGISALTGDVTASGTGSVSSTVNKVNGVAYPSAPATNTVPVVTGANTITYQTVPIAAGGTGATTQSGAANNILPSQGSNAGKVLQTNGTDVSWVTPNAGTVTGVTASAPLASSGGAAPNITISQANTTTNGYLSSTDWNTFNNKQGTALNNGLVWVGNGSNVAAARTLNISDIKSTVSGAWFTASGLCANGKSLQYVSASDTVSCQDYALTSSQVTTALGYTPADGANYVAKTGDTMTGALNLPANGLLVGTNQLAAKNGKVGIGTASPSEELHISGSGVSQDILIEATDANDAALGLKQGGKTWSLDIDGNGNSGTARNFHILEDNSANSRLTIAQGGNVGIGTTNPGAKLEVAGQVKITGGSPGVGKVLTSDAAGLATWVLPASSGGTVTGVTATAPLSSDGNTTTPNITISQANASTNGYLSSTDWNTFNNKLGTGSTFAGDVSGTSATTSVDKIKGKSVVPAAYSAGQILRYDGANWVNTALSSADLANDSNLLKASNMPANCASNQTLTFSSPTGTWVCSTIASLDAGVIATGTIAAARLPASATYWSAATGGINYAGGNVGIGITSPAQALDVGGAVAVSGTTVIDANGYQKLKVVTEDSDCSSIGVGTIAVDSDGNVLACQN